MRRRRLSMFNLTPWKKAENAGPGALTTAQASPLNRFRREFDALFDRFFGPWPSTMDADWWGLQPFWGVDVDDQEDKVMVRAERSEEHTSELQSHSDLVCRLLLEKKKKRNKKHK